MLRGEASLFARRDDRKNRKGVAGKSGQSPMTGLRWAVTAALRQGLLPKKRLIGNDSNSDAAAFEAAVIGRFGILPNFFLITRTLRPLDLIPY